MLIQFINNFQTIWQKYLAVWWMSKWHSQKKIWAKLYPYVQNPAFKSYTTIARVIQDRSHAVSAGRRWIYIGIDITAQPQTVWYIWQESVKSVAKTWWHNFSCSRRNLLKRHNRNTRKHITRLETQKVSTTVRRVKIKIQNFVPTWNTGAVIRMYATSESVGFGIALIKMELSM